MASSEQVQGSLAVGEKRDLTSNKDGGVIKHLLVEGEGIDNPSSNDHITLRYVAYKGNKIAKEYEFDSSEKDGKDFTFQMSRGAVIRGFETAIGTMKKGERSVIYLKPEYAFGRGGAPPKIAANTSVIFDTTLLDFHGEDLSYDKDLSVTKHVIKKGHGWSQPNEGCMITIYIVGRHNGRVFQDKEVAFPYGEGSSQEFGVPVFVEQYLDMWKIDEVSRLCLTSKNAYGEKGCPELEVPPNADLEYEITVKGFERIKDVWEMNSKEKMDQCDMYKNKGTMYFKRQEYELAKKFYLKMIDNIEFDLCMQGGEEERRRVLLVAGHLNLSLVHLKQGNDMEASKSADKVLRIDAENIKALFRKAQAQYNMKNYEVARDYFEAALELDPGNKAARNHVTLCTKYIKESVSGEQQLCKKMMSKVGKGPDTPAVPYNNAMGNIDEWNNTMAQGMMTLEQERAAFGDVMPVKGDNNHGHED